MHTLRLVIGLLMTVVLLGLAVLVDPVGPAAPGLVGLLHGEDIPGRGGLA